MLSETVQDRTVVTMTD